MDGSQKISCFVCLQQPGDKKTKTHFKAKTKRPMQLPWISLLANRGFE